MLTPARVLWLQLLQQEGVEEDKITVVTLVTCPEAADKFCEVRVALAPSLHAQDIR
jgi:hypothetical protein